jgi:hypothetical protein
VQNLLEILPNLLTTLYKPRVSVGMPAQNIFDIEEGYSLDAPAKQIQAPSREIGATGAAVKNTVSRDKHLSMRPVDHDVSRRMPGRMKNPEFGRFPALKFQSPVLEIDIHFPAQHPEHFLVVPVHRDHRLRFSLDRHGGFTMVGVPMRQNNQADRRKLQPFPVHLRYQSLESLLAVSRSPVMPRIDQQVSPLLEYAREKACIAVIVASAPQIKVKVVEYVHGILFLLIGIFVLLIRRITLIFIYR